MSQFSSEMTLLNYVLIAGLVWLSGVFIWLIKVFVDAYAKNTAVITKVQGTLEGVDKKLDSAAERDSRIVATLAAIHARQAPYVTVVEKSVDNSEARG